MESRLGWRRAADIKPDRQLGTLPSYCSHSLNHPNMDVNVPYSGSNACFLKWFFYSYVRCVVGAIAEPKVFVVDDEVQIADLLSLNLRAVSSDIETFYDARSALQRASSCLPDVLVSDITMPGMDGITLAETLRKQNPNCKVILISGSPNWKTHGNLQSGKLGDFTLLLKPFSIKHLLCLITSKLEQRLRPTG